MKVSVEVFLVYLPLVLQKRSESAGQSPYPFHLGSVADSAVAAPLFALALSALVAAPLFAPAYLGSAGLDSAAPDSAVVALVAATFSVPTLN